MSFRGSPSMLVAGLLVLTGPRLMAQPASSGPASPPPSAAARAAAAASRNAARQTALASKEIPDPALFDGSGQPSEVRPDKGMLAEFELPGSTDRPETREQQRQGQGEQQGGGGGGAEGEQAGAGSGPKPEGAGDPTAKAEGIAVAELQADENSASQQAAPPPKPRDVSMGDRAMQIPTAVAQQSVVGAQQPGAGQQGVSNSQQYEKGAASGKSSGNNQNKGLEKGRVIPQGL